MHLDHIDTAVIALGAMMARDFYYRASQEDYETARERLWDGKEEAAVRFERFATAHHRRFRTMEFVARTVGDAATCSGAVSYLGDLLRDAADAILPPDAGEDFGQRPDSSEEETALYERARTLRYVASLLECVEREAIEQREGRR